MGISGGSEQEKPESRHSLNSKIELSPKIKAVNLKTQEIQGKHIWKSKNEQEVME